MGLNFRKLAAAAVIVGMVFMLGGCYEDEDVPVRPSTPAGGGGGYVGPAPTFSGGCVLNCSENPLPVTSHTGSNGLGYG